MNSWGRVMSLVAMHGTIEEFASIRDAASRHDGAAVYDAVLAIADRANLEIACALRQARHSFLDALPEGDMLAEFDALMLNDVEKRASLRVLVHRALADGMAPERLLSGPSLSILLERLLVREQEAHGDPAMVDLLRELYEYVVREAIGTREVLRDLGRLPASERS